MIKPKKNLTYYLQLGRRIRKLTLHIRRFTLYAVPKKWWKHHIPAFDDLTDNVQNQILRRAEYYCRINSQKLEYEGSTAVSEYKYPFGKKKKWSNYFFDLYKTIRYFPANLRFHYLFGDINYEPNVPTFVKSRPITDGETNGVLMRLNAARHFNVIKDNTPYKDKLDKLIFRNIVYQQPWRTAFLQRWFDHPMVDAGQVNEDPTTEHPEWIKPFMARSRMLQYKFVACIEGNDVTTALKWVMASNSIAVMPKPRIESWFMEGILIPNYHYIEVRPDYEDLVDKLQYYIDHPKEAEEIISHAHQYVSQFLDPRVEQLTSLVTAQRYFALTKQIKGQGII